jgi:hypothetical protein
LLSRIAYFVGKTLSMFGMEFTSSSATGDAAANFEKAIGVTAAFRDAVYSTQRHQCLAHCLTTL